MSHMDYTNLQQTSAPQAPSTYPQQTQIYPPIRPNGFSSSIPTCMPQPIHTPLYPPTSHASVFTVSSGLPGCVPAGWHVPSDSWSCTQQHNGNPVKAPASVPEGSFPYPPQIYNPHDRTSYISKAAPTSETEISTNYGFSINIPMDVPQPVSMASYTTPSSSHGDLPIQQYSNAVKKTPTVVPANPFNPRADVEVLRKAMKGLGTDEKTIINVLTRRSNTQRTQIAEEFKTLHGKDLIKDLKSELSGNFKNLVVALMTPLTEFYAKELNKAIEGLGTDEDVLIEILCTKSNDEIRIIRDTYHSMYRKTLENDIKGDTSGTFKRLMVSLCNACRDESMTVNPQAAQADATALLRAGELRLGTDESTFNMILCQRNYAQLQLVFQEYQRMTGHDIEKAIKNEFSGDAEDGFLAIIRAIKNQPAFFAKMLRKSMKGLGTNNKQLIRIVVTRCEIDMVEIKKEYKKMYGESLAEAIKGDCSGDYKKCLLVLIGEGEAIHNSNVAPRREATFGKNYRHSYMSANKSQPAPKPVSFHNDNTYTQQTNKSLRSSIKEDCFSNYKGCPLDVRKSSYISKPTRPAAVSIIPVTETQPMPRPVYAPSTLPEGQDLSTQQKIKPSNKLVMGECSVKNRRYSSGVSNEGKASYVPVPPRTAVANPNNCGLPSNTPTYKPHLADKSLYNSKPPSAVHQFFKHKMKRTPTVVPARPFDPRADAELLLKAMKGLGTDEKTIINVLTRRSNAQRLQIAKEFKTLYGKDLIKNLKSELSGNFENLVVALMTPLRQFYATELKRAIEGLGTDENVLIEVLCTKSNREIGIIKDIYYNMYGNYLEDDIIGDTSGTFKRLMVSLCNAHRDESTVTDPQAAKDDAKALLRAGELRLGTDESTFNMILCQRNYAQLQLVFQQYRRITGHDIEQAIKAEFSGDAKDGFLAVIRSIRNQAGFFAKMLNKSVKGLGTDDRQLIRVVVTRCEIDMVEIKNEYRQKYGESLAEAIKGDCSGDYKKCLLALIKEA